MGWIITLWILIALWLFTSMIAFIDYRKWSIEQGSWNYKEAGLAILMAIVLVPILWGCYASVLWHNIRVGRRSGKGQ